QRCRVEVERARDRRDRAKAAEAEREHRFAHLGPVALPLVLATEPRPRLELAAGGKHLAADVLRAGGGAADEHAKEERPALRAPLHARTEVVCEGRVRATRCG